MFPNPPPTFAYCKRWGVGVPQWLSLGSAQIKVRVGLGPSARPACPSTRLSAYPCGETKFQISSLIVEMSILIFQLEKVNFRSSTPEISTRELRRNFSIPLMT